MKINLTRHLCLVGAASLAAALMTLVGCETAQPAATPPPTAVVDTPAPSPDPTTEEPDVVDTPTPREEPEPSAEPTPTVEEKPAVLYAPGDVDAQIRELQHRLRQLEWLTGDITDTYDERTEDAVTGFQAKRELPETGAVDQDTLDALHKMTRKPTVAELADQPPPKQDSSAWDARCLTGRAVCVSKQNRQLAWIVDGTVQLTADVRFGSELTPTRTGSFSVSWKSRDHVSSLYHTSMPYALFFSGGQAIHYSPDFAATGYNGASHGCVNLRDKAVAERLFDAVASGTPVIVY